MLNLRYWLKHPNLIVPRIRYWIYEKQNRDKPWLCPGTIAYLSNHLNKDMLGAEFGSGRSTHWIAKHIKHLISIEHHKAWYETVKKQIEDSSLKNVDYRFIPLSHVESEPEQQNYNPLPDYVAWLESCADNSLDFVLVDGHYRSTCIRAALNKLKVGGMLVVDDIELWQNSDGPPIPSSWNCVDSSTNGIKTTKIWVRT